MKKFSIGAIALLIVVGSAFVFAGDTPAKSADAAKAESPLKALAPYIGGEWKIKGAWKDGNPLEGREVFDWGVGKKFITCKTFVMAPKGEYQRYENVFGVQDGKLMNWAFVVDGEVVISEFKIEGKKLSSSRAMPGDKPGVLHQSIELVEPNKFRWLVTIEQDGQMNNVMDGMWVREASAAAAPAK